MNMDVVWWVVATLLIVIGVAGTVLPALPGPLFVLGGVALAAWIEGFTRVGVAAVAIVGVLAVLAWILFGEALTPVVLAGMALTAVGVWLVVRDTSPVRPVSQRSPAPAPAPMPARRPSK